MYDKILCPHCLSLNLVYLGNWEDDTSISTQAAQCFQCQKCFLLSPDDSEMLEIIILNNFEEDNHPNVNELLQDKQKLSDFLFAYADIEKGQKI